MELVDALDTLSREELLALVRSQAALIEQLQQQVLTLNKQIEQLRAQLPGAKPPAFVKANRAPRQEKPRKKRTQQFVRPREEPTQVRYHARARCPDCGQLLQGGWEHRRRQLIEIPKSPAVITDHVVMARHCGVCNKRCLPELDLSDQVLGQHRVGLRLMSLIAYLRQVGRLPLRTIQRLLKLQYNLHLSVGELVEVLHTVARAGKGEYERLLGQVRQSPSVHADETGWRESGKNGYLWTFSTALVRYFVYDKSRGSRVPHAVLGEAFGGVLVSDFYGGYSPLLCGHQRCWVHLLRDLRELVEIHPSSGAWVARVRAVYDRAKALPLGSERARSVACAGFKAELRALCAPYAVEEVPERALASRMLRFLSELFVFVRDPGVASENNLAERSLRPCVISRKISGGTRSSLGSGTRATLMSLFGSWLSQGLDPWQSCQQMLAARPP